MKNRWARGRHTRKGTRARGEQRKEKSQRGEMREAHSCNNKTKGWGGMSTRMEEKGRMEEGRKETRGEEREGGGGGGLFGIAKKESVK